MSMIGDNSPPGMTVTAAETARGLSDWMKDHPAISTEDDAREAKVFVDRGRLCIKDMEDERDSQVRPLNEKVKTINEFYRGPRRLLQMVLDQLEDRLGSFLRAEEDRRIRAATEAARVAAEAERLARLAEAAEQEKLANAAAGELDIDVEAVVAEADEKFAEFQKASRQAAIAERETKVKIGGGFSRAIGLRNETELVVVDHVLALEALGPTEYIMEAILKSARVYKKLNGKLPTGVEALTSRGI
jgi:hypothetical protein